MTNAAEEIFLHKVAEQKKHLEWLRSILPTLSSEEATYTQRAISQGSHILLGLEADLEDIRARAVIRKALQQLK